MNMKKTFTAAGIALALGVASATASAATFEDFVVDETILGVGGETFTADKINGGYAEKITFDGMGGFVTNAFADFGIYFADDGLTSVTSDLDDTYAMYALFDADGTVAPIGPGLFSFTGGSGSFSLFLDPDQDTTKTLGATGSDPIILGGDTSDDLLLASSSVVVSGAGILVTGIGGFFDLIFDEIALTDDGKDYFVDPDPFYILANVDGDFDTFDVAGTQTLTGDVSFVFRVPEPGILGLMGIALLGLGLSRRKA